MIGGTEIVNKEFQPAPYLYRAGADSPRPRRAVFLAGRLWAFSDYAVFAREVAPALSRASQTPIVIQ
jgi:hypothetical protein